MKKIRLNKLEALDSALTREQLKGIMGGSSSSSTGGDTPKPCDGKSEGDTCYLASVSKYGTCKGSIYGLYCYAV